MTVHPMPSRALSFLLSRLSGRLSGRIDDPAEIRRRARIELAHLPAYLKLDIGLFNE